MTAEMNSNKAEIQLVKAAEKYFNKRGRDQNYCYLHDI